MQTFFSLSGALSTNANNAPFNPIGIFHTKIIWQRYSLYVIQCLEIIEDLFIERDEGNNNFLMFNLNSKHAIVRCACMYILTGKVDIYV